LSDTNESYILLYWSIIVSKMDFFFLEIEILNCNHGDWFTRASAQQATLGRVEYQDPSQSVSHGALFYSHARDPEHAPHKR
jgi:hypothetical protein